MTWNNPQVTTKHRLLLLYMSILVNGINKQIAKTMTSKNLGNLGDL